jgi:hypothetical protein
MRTYQNVEHNGAALNGTDKSVDLGLEIARAEMCGEDISIN